MGAATTGAALLMGVAVAPTGAAAALPMCSFDVTVDVLELVTRARRSDEGWKCALAASCWLKNEQPTCPANKIKPTATADATSFKWRAEIPILALTISRLECVPVELLAGSKGIDF